MASINKVAETINKTKIIKKETKNDSLRKRRERIENSKITYDDASASFSKIQYKVDVNNLEELFENMRHNLKKSKQTGQGQLAFKNLNRNEIVFVTIDTAYMENFEDFKDRVDAILEGNVTGSDRWNEAEYELDLNTYAINYIHITGNAKSDKLLFKCVGLDGDRKSKCYEKVLNYIYDGNDDCLKADFRKASEFDKFQECVIKIGGYDIISNSYNVIDKEILINKPKVEFNHNGRFFKAVKLERVDIIPVTLYSNGNEKKVIYDTLNKHYDVIDGELEFDNIYLSTNGITFKRIDDKYIKVLTCAELVKTNSNVKYDHFYIYFDYETIINYDVNNCCQEYSVSFLVINDEDLEQLELFDKKNDAISINNLVKGKLHNYVGFDSGMRFVKWVMKHQSNFIYNSKNHKLVKFTFCSFNGANFDNILLLSKLFQTPLVNVDKIFYNGNQLLDFRVNGRHTTFDLAKHLVGSLSYNCTAFKVRCVAKTSFNHYEAQKLFDSSPESLIEHMNNNQKLIDYNNRDVLSLAVLMKRYMNALTAIPISKPYGDDLISNRTIGAIIWDIAKKHFEKIHVSLPPLQPEYYNDILKYKSAGRVELFNGCYKIPESLVSMDQCSMYPTNMAVKNNNWYPCGEVVETDHYVQDKLGFYYCDVDQSNLKINNLPNILPEKMFDSNGNLIENDWGTNKILHNYLISTVLIDQLQKYGCKITIKNGIYFTGKIKGCELFEFILDFMEVKNHQDLLAREESPEYNSAIREMTKLLMNSTSGKVIEGLHVDKTELVTAEKFLQIKNDPTTEKINAINIVEGKVFCSYTRTQESMMKEQRPIYLGVFIYDYSKCGIYNDIYSVIGLNRLGYTDTDSAKFRKIELERDDVIDALSEPVDVWPEVLKKFPKFIDFPKYSLNDKVFGSYEDEFSKLQPDVNYGFQKKFWVSWNKKLYEDALSKGIQGEQFDKTYKMGIKGVSRRAVILDGNEPFLSKELKKGECRYYIQSQDSKEANDYYENSNKIIRELPRLCEKLCKDKSVLVLCSSLKKVIKNPKKNDSLTNTKRMNSNNNTIQYQIVVKHIKLNKNDVDKGNL